MTTQQHESQRSLNPSFTMDFVESVLSTRDNGLAWILARIGDDGQPIGGLDKPCYYRLPWMLAITGNRETGASVLSWIERNALTAEGDLQPFGGRFIARWSGYPLAQLATGAWHLERFDTGLAIMRTLRAFQDITSGGAYAERPEVRQTVRQDLMTTAQLGLTALVTGQGDMGQGAFEWVVRLYDAQPDLPRRLYTGWGADGLITTFAPTLAYELLTDLEKPRQAFFNPGIAAAFLARYFMATGTPLALELARAYLDLSAQATEEQFDYTESKQVCKFAWGAAALLEADPQGDYADHLIRMGKWFADSQLEDGRWQNSPFLAPSPTDEDDLNITSEFVLYLTMMLGAIGGRARGAVADVTP